MSPQKESTSSLVENGMDVPDRDAATPGFIISITGPSGVGKTTLIKKQCENSELFALVVSHTTRKRRATEVNHREYHFVDKETFQKDLAAGKFIEHVQYMGNLYGTSVKAIEHIHKQGQICILDINTDAVQSMKKTEYHKDTVYIYISPPSKTELERRLRKRDSENEETIKKRLAEAEKENKFASISGSFDHYLTNDDLQETYEKLKNIIDENMNDKGLADLMATQCEVGQPCSDNVSAVQAGEVNCCNGDLHPTHVAAKSPTSQCQEERKESLQSVNNAQHATELVPSMTTEQPAEHRCNTKPAVALNTTELDLLHVVTP